MEIRRQEARKLFRRENSQRYENEVTEDGVVKMKGM